MLGQSLLFQKIIELNQESSIKRDRTCSDFSSINRVVVSTVSTIYSPNGEFIPFSQEQQQQQQTDRKLNYCHSSLMVNGPADWFHILPCQIRFKLSQYPTQSPLLWLFGWSVDFHHFLRFHGSVAAAAGGAE